jgi:hypothetical protein
LIRRSSVKCRAGIQLSKSVVDADNRDRNKCEENGRGNAREECL